MVYSCNHDTEGEVTLSMGHGKKLDHMGIQVKFFGRIDMVCKIYRFHSLFVSFWCGTRLSFMCIDLQQSKTYHLILVMFANCIYCVYI